MKTILTILLLFFAQYSSAAIQEIAWGETLMKCSGVSNVTKTRTELLAGYNKNNNTFVIYQIHDGSNLDCFLDDGAFPFPITLAFNKITRFPEYYGYKFDMTFTNDSAPRLMLKVGLGDDSSIAFEGTLSCN